MEIVTDGPTPGSNPEAKKKSSAHLTREKKSEILRAKKKRNKENRRKLEADSGVPSVSNAEVSNASSTITKGRLLVCSDKCGT